VATDEFETTAGGFVAHALNKTITEMQKSFATLIMGTSVAMGGK